MKTPTPNERAVKSHYAILQTLRMLVVLSGTQPKLNLNFFHFPL